MIIGVPREIKTHEYRVALTPDGARELIGDGHKVLMEKGAGLGSGFSDYEYIEAGAQIKEKAEIFKESDLIIKVKEPLSEEYPLFKKGQALFTYLHLAADPPLLDFLITQGICALGYETLTESGALPLLAPMSEIAGRMSPIVGAYFLQRPLGGSGVLASGASGVPPAEILILGGGTVGTNAARVALGLGMRVVVINRGIERLRELDELFMGRVTTLPSTRHNIEASLRVADIVVCAVLVTGQRAPVLIKKEMLALMKKGSVIVDVSIDQGGCVETSRPTTHREPTYEVDGIIHYAVANMPGAYPRTSTLALTNRTLPYIKRLASLGIERAIKEESAIRSALNTYNGMVMHEGLSQSTGIPLGRL